MTMAISKARARRAPRPSSARRPATPAPSAAAYAAKAGLTCAVLVPDGKIALGKLARRSRTARGCCRSRATSTTACGWRASSPRPTRWRWSTRSTRPASRARRRRRSRSSTRSATRPTSTACRSATPATSPRTGRATPSTPRDRPAAPHPADVGLPGRRCRADRPRPPGRRPGHHRHRDPDRQPGVLGQAQSTARDESGGPHRRGHRRADPRRAPAAVGPRGRLRRAGVSAASVAGLLQCHEQGVLDPGQLVVCTVTGTGSRTRDRRCPG